MCNFFKKNDQQQFEHYVDIFPHFKNKESIYAFITNQGFAVLPTEMCFFAVKQIWSFSIAAPDNFENWPMAGITNGNFDIAMIGDGVVGGRENLLT